MTTTETQTRSQTTAHAEQLFARVLVGVDRSPESVEAARQAAVLTEPDGTLTLAAGWTVPTPAIGVVGPTFANELNADAYREPAETAVAIAKAAIADLATPATKVVRGMAWDVLAQEIEHEDSTLVAVGSHGQGRLRGIVMGSTATEVVHKAPCSVLVARAAGEQFPRRIVVGIDGSRESAAAYAVAQRLAERFGSDGMAGRGPRRQGSREAAGRCHRRRPLGEPAGRAGHSSCRGLGRRRSRDRREPRTAGRQGARLGLRTGRPPGPLLDAGRPLVVIVDPAV